MSLYAGGQRIFGRRGGWSNSSSGYLLGTGLLNAVVQGNGTGSTMISSVGTTDGHFCQHTTGTNNTFARAGWWGNLSVMRKFNPQFTIRFRINTTWASGQGILYIGLVNQTTQPAAGTSMLGTYLDGKIGVFYGFRAADTHWMIISNNAQGTATYTDTGVACDNLVHTLSIKVHEASFTTAAAIDWELDGVPQTSITNVNNVPPTSTLLSPLLIYEAQTATNLNVIERWSELSCDWV